MQKSGPTIQGVFLRKWELNNAKGKMDVGKDNNSRSLDYKGNLHRIVGKPRGLESKVRFWPGETTYKVYPCAALFQFDFQMRSEWTYRDVAERWPGLKNQSR